MSELTSKAQYDPDDHRVSKRVPFDYAALRSGNGLSEAEGRSPAKKSRR